MNVRPLGTQLLKKRRNRKGFTLAETLLAILILLIVSGIVAAGIPAAKYAYERTVLASNAEVLLSTTLSTLRNELGTARDIQLQGAGEEATSITYFEPGRGAASRIFVEDGGEIRFQRYYGGDGPEYEAVSLISQKTATADLYVTYSSVAYQDGIVIFKDLSVNRASGAEGLAQRATFSIRVIPD